MKHSQRGNSTKVNICYLEIEEIRSICSFLSRVFQIFNNDITYIMREMYKDVFNFINKKLCITTIEIILKHQRPNLLESQTLFKPIS